MTQRTSQPTRTSSNQLLLTLSHRLLMPLLLWLVAAAAVVADEAQPIWLLSTRCAAHCGELDDPHHAVCYSRATADCQWLPSDAAAFQTTDNAQVPTIVFVHGNRTDADEAITKGCCAYEGMRTFASGRPFRFVIWSWPAERALRKHRADTQLKAEYSDAESYYLAYWLNNLRPGMPVALVGHSFGPRIIAGALHLLAGGAIDCRQLPNEITVSWATGKRNPVRVMLLAAAMDGDALSPNGQNALALPLSERSLITVNECDRVLKWYPRLYGRGGPEALGFLGPCGLTGNADILDISSSVGRTHDWDRYCAAVTACGLWSQYTFLDQSAESPSLVTAAAKQYTATATQNTAVRLTP